MTTRKTDVHSPAASPIAVEKESNASRPGRQRLFLGDVHYPPFQRQWDERCEGDWSVQCRVAEIGHQEPISEYSWLRLMGRDEEATRELASLLPLVLEAVSKRQRGAERHSRPSELEPLNPKLLQKWLPGILAERNIVSDEHLRAALLPLILRTNRDQRHGSGR